MVMTDGRLPDLISSKPADNSTEWRGRAKRGQYLCECRARFLSGPRSGNLSFNSRYSLERTKSAKAPSGR
ncbi:unnamed protein product [Blepharisma stoltei]|uniref:Uncharacterized protein n=1 Tax=Blepharisma stoltei TaxID=1481888 RepID=A0AAU9IX22_9CILI|nr:unnamed protein product [Blepharisma stoltei]